MSPLFLAHFRGARMCAEYSLFSVRRTSQHAANTGTTTGNTHTTEAVLLRGGRLSRSLCLRVCVSLPLFTCLSVAGAAGLQQQSNSRQHASTSRSATAVVAQDWSSPQTRWRVRHRQQKGNWHIPTFVAKSSQHPSIINSAHQEHRAHLHSHA